MTHQFPDNDTLIPYLIGDLSSEARARIERKLSDRPDDMESSNIQSARALAHPEGRYEFAGKENGGE